MDKSQIKALFVESLKESVGLKRADVGDDLKLRDDLGLDSLDMISLVTEVQTRTEIAIETTDLSESTTVGDIVNLLHAKLGSATSLPKAA